MLPDPYRSPLRLDVLAADVAAHARTLDAFYPAPIDIRPGNVADGPRLTRTHQMLVKLAVLHAAVDALYAAFPDLDDMAVAMAQAGAHLLEIVGQMRIRVSVLVTRPDLQGVVAPSHLPDATLALHEAVSHLGAATERGHRADFEMELTRAWLILADLARTWGFDLADLVRQHVVLAEPDARIHILPTGKGGRA